MTMRISDVMSVHDLLDRAFFEHRRALLHFDFHAALELLRVYERDLIRHMSDEEDVLLPIYEERCEFPPHGAPKLYLADHEKMRAHLQLFRQKIADLPFDADIDRTLLNLLGREDFYLRLCSHHDKREAEFLYPLLDKALADEEKVDVLRRLSFKPTDAETPELTIGVQT